MTKFDQTKRNETSYKVADSSLIVIIMDGNTSLQGRVLQFILDTFLGIVFACIIWHLDERAIFDMSRIVYLLVAHRIQQHIHWLMGWPAGLKLNDNLDKMLGSLSLAGIDWWTDVLRFMSPLFPIVFASVVAVSFIGGLSCLIAFLSDLLNLVNAHFLLFYELSAKIYGVFLQVVTALWRLFRGKKKNVLRQNRIDECNYSTDQLVLGTLFFTLLVFLFPTVAVYYFSFAFVYFLLKNLQVLLLHSAIIVVRHYPTWMLLLWLFGRLPLGGFYFEHIPAEQIRSPYKSSVVNHVYFTLKVCPSSIVFPPDVIVIVFFFW